MNCPACQSEISRDETICPVCRLPQKLDRKALLVFIENQLETFIREDKKKLYCIRCVLYLSTINKEELGELDETIVRELVDTFFSFTEKLPGWRWAEEEWLSSLLNRENLKLYKSKYKPDKSGMRVKMSRKKIIKKLQTLIEDVDYDGYYETRRPLDYLETKKPPGIDRTKLKYAVLLGLATVGAVLYFILPFI